MATVETEQPIDSLADLLDRLGCIGAERVRFRPPPGTATEQDIVDIEGRENRLCELVDGTLVEKVMGYRESLLAGAILVFLRGFVDARNLGLITGPDGMMRLYPGLVRIPDVAFTSWDRLPAGRVPEQAIPDLAPDLAVEVLSKGNTPGEMDRKLHEYFDAGVRLAWLVDLDTRTVEVYCEPNRSTTHYENQSLDGGDVLPGFSLELSRLFAELDRQSDR